MSVVWLVLTEVADFPMMRKCLLGIKRRAETRAVGSSLKVASISARSR
jgi:hypothetical protein